MAYKIKTKPVKEKEETDIFRIAPTEKEEENDFKIEDTKKLLEGNSDSYQEDKQDKIKEVQDDLFSEDMPIEIQDETTLFVRASGQTHTITRNDLVEYQKRYGGTGEGMGSGIRQLGTIQGDWRPIDNIASDVSFTFNKLDEKLGTYKTSEGED